MPETPDITDLLHQRLVVAGLTDEQATEVLELAKEMGERLREAHEICECGRRLVDGRCAAHGEQ